MAHKLALGYAVVFLIVIGFIIFKYEPTPSTEECKIASESDELPKCEPAYDISAPGFTM